jgi:large subunit ribosomal protein L10
VQVENPRPEKVAVVDEVRSRFESAQAVLVTEYRGLDVAASSQLRRALRAAGGDYKIYKNTLVRFAARDLDLELEDLLVGPTALAFVEGDAVDVAKALRDFARGNPNLIVKGGLLGTRRLDADQARALADVESREVLLSRLAGMLAAPMQQFAGLLQAVPRNFAYGLQALIDQKGGAPAGADESEPAEAEAPAADAPAAEAPAAEAPATEAPAAEAAPAAEVPAEPAVVAEAAPAEPVTEEAAPAEETPRKSRSTKAAATEAPAEVTAEVTAEAATETTPTEAPAAETPAPQAEAEEERAAEE